VPALSAAALVIETVVLVLPVVRGFVPKAIAGATGVVGVTLDVSVILVLKPPTYVAVNVVCNGPGAGHAETTGAGLLKVNPDVAALIVKLVLEISKKILPTASIQILAEVVAGITGRFSDSEPSFAVLAVNSCGYVKPPSTDNVILTLATLNGAAVVPALFQVIV